MRQLENFNFYIDKKVAVSSWHIDPTQQLGVDRALGGGTW